MRFEVTNKPETVWEHTVEKQDNWTWTLVKGDEAIARSTERWDTQEECRSAIAAFRKSAGGVKFAKVKTIDP